MKRILLIIISCLLVNANLWAQDEVKEKDTPVGPAFENGTLIDAQTSNIPDAKSLEFVIQHKFSPIKGDKDRAASDLFGLLSSANVRLALNYVPIQNVQIGAGVAKSMGYIYTDVNGKWNILKQTENNTVPVFVTVFGNAAVDGRPKADFGQLNNYENPTDTFGVKFNDRMSYFAQLIVGRKFSESISLQGGVSFSHANYVRAWHDHDRVSLHVSGRLKFSGQSSFIFNFDAPLKIDKISEQHSDWSMATPPHPDWNGPYNPKPSLKFGVEISTFTHAFQIYVGNASAILPQMDMMNNMNKPFEGLAFGFTITRLWMY